MFARYIGDVMLHRRAQIKDLSAQMGRVVRAATPDRALNSLPFGRTRELLSIYCGDYIGETALLYLCGPILGRFIKPFVARIATDTRVADAMIQVEPIDKNIGSPDNAQHGVSPQKRPPSLQRSAGGAKAPTSLAMTYLLSASIRLKSRKLA